jgi:hypothetical protein
MQIAPPAASLLLSAAVPAASAAGSGGSYRIVCISGAALAKCGPSLRSSGAAAALDAVGDLSARAQQLKAPITGADKLISQPDQRLYLALDRDTLLGMIKVGKKTLFIRVRRRRQA